MSYPFEIEVRRGTSPSSVGSRRRYKCAAAEGLGEVRESVMGVYEAVLLLQNGHALGAADLNLFSEK